MANYICNYQKKNKIFAKRERALEGAIKRNESPEHLAVLAEKLRQSKLQAIKAIVGSRNQVASRCTVEKWLVMTLEEIIQMYRKKCEQSHSETTSEPALRTAPEAPDP